MQSNARAGRVSKPPKRVAPRADERIRKIPWNTLGIFPHHRQQLILTCDRKAVEICAVALVEVGPEFLSRFDRVKRSLRSGRPLFRPTARFGRFCAGGVRSGERSSSSQRSLSKPRIAGRAGAVRIAPLSQGTSPNGGAPAPQR
jgi:hypothetical protein